jgi:hypothetical protein
MNESFWNKTTEMAYLMSLIDGSLWEHVPHKPTKTVAQMLRNYIRSVERRIEWHTWIRDGQSVLAYAKAELERLES